jgi:hypothetical protein
VFPAEKIILLLSDDNDKMGAGKSQEQKDMEIYNRANELLAENGYPQVTQNTTKVPEQFDNRWPAKWFFGAIERMRPRMKEADKVKLYTQKFKIAGGPALSRYERRGLSLINPENPFDTQPGEGEDRVFAFIDQNKDKVGLAHGGHRYRGQCGGTSFGSRGMKRSF